MSAIDPRMAAVPEQFAVFPLTGALLLPHGRLPLNIFEPRYLAMIEDALGASRYIGIIQPDSLAPAGASGPGLQRVGCVGRVISFTETDDGRYLITLGGVIRFTVAEELPLRRGYRSVRGDFAAFMDDLPPLPETIEAPDRAAMLTALRGYFDRHGVEANWEALGRMPDAMLVATLAMGCPFEPMEKQALLEAPDLAARASTLLALLHIDTHAPPSDDGARRPS